MPLFVSANVTVERDADGSGVLILDVRDRSVNVFTRQVLADLDAALDAVRAERGLPVLIVRSGKPTGFLAGADLSEFLAIRDEAAAVALSTRGQTLFNKLASLPMRPSRPSRGRAWAAVWNLRWRATIAWCLTSRPRNWTARSRTWSAAGLGGTHACRASSGWNVPSGSSSAASGQWRARPCTGISPMRARPTEKGLRDRVCRVDQTALSQGKRPCERYPIAPGGNGAGIEPDRPAFRLSWGEHLIQRRACRTTCPARRGAGGGARWLSARHGSGPGSGAGCGGPAGDQPGVSQPDRPVFREGDAATCWPSCTERRRRSSTSASSAQGRWARGITELAAIAGSVVVEEIHEAALGAGLVKIKSLIDKAVDRGAFSGGGDAPSSMASAVSLTGKLRSGRCGVGGRLEIWRQAGQSSSELEARTRPGPGVGHEHSSLAGRPLQEGLQPERLAGLHFFNPVHRCHWSRWRGRGRH